MLETIKDNNEWISSVTGKPINSAGVAVVEGDEDAIPNPDSGNIVTVEHPDPEPSPELVEQPSKADLMAKVNELLAAIAGLPD